MKKLFCFITVLLMLWLMTLRANAPPNNCLVIPAGERIGIYGLKDPTLIAFMRLESKFKERAVNQRTGARGILQITPVMIREVNKICKRYSKTWKYTWADAWSPEKSIEIWYIVQTVKNPNYDLEKAVKIWFGTGRQYDGKTWRWYLEVVKGYL